MAHVLDLSGLSETVDFVVGKVEGGLVCYCQVGDVECFGDTPQEAVDAAAKAFYAVEAEITNQAIKKLV